MKTALLNLISTPIPVVNSLGLDVAVGLSSDDPIGNRRASEAFEAYLTVYRPDGTLAERVHLGEIPPARRQLFDVTAITRRSCPGDDHLVVAHRIPRRLLGGHAPEDVVEVTPEDGDFAMYRSLVQYSYPGRANGSVIYETPPNVATQGGSNVLQRIGDARIPLHGGNWHERGALVWYEAVHENRIE